VHLRLDAVCLREVVERPAALIMAVAGELAPGGPDPDHPRLDAEGDSDGGAVEQDRSLRHTLRLPERDHPVMDPYRLGRRPAQRARCA
jgi:hypothetical protein